VVARAAAAQESERIEQRRPKQPLDPIQLLTQQQWGAKDVAAEE